MPCQVRFQGYGQNPDLDHQENDHQRHRSELAFTAADAGIVVPNEQWSHELHRVRNAGQEMTVELYAQMIDRELAATCREDLGE